MKRDEMIELAEKMTQYGGSFAIKIGYAIFCADDKNLKKLDKEFGDLIKSYRRFLC